MPVSELRPIAARLTAFWWAILGVSVFTDFLYLPVAFALYLALKELNRNLMLLATAFVGLFVVLDLAVTWSDYASVLTLYRNYTTATDDASRASYIAAANYASAMLTSPLENRVCTRDPLVRDPLDRSCNV